MFFEYDEEGVKYLREKDEKLKEVIDFIGPIREPIEQNPFAGIIYHILGQQISVRVQDTLWDRLRESVQPLTPENIIRFGRENLRALGMSNRKAETIYSIAQLVTEGDLDFEALRELDDETFIKELTKIKGIGKWTAEMLLMFSYNRQDVFTFGDVALNRGLKMVYDIDKISKDQFEEFKEKFSPYGTLASLYFWAVGEYKREGIEEFIEELHMKKKEEGE